MPSKSKTTKTAQQEALIVFYPIVALTLLLWILYRSLFQFPVWFDEIIGKALFFGFPVWLFYIISGEDSIVDSFAPRKLQNGLLLGVAVGGMFGFVTSLVSLAQSGGVVQSALLFTNEVFWKEFTLAIFTGFWETLLFFSFVMTIIIKKYPKWSFINQGLLAAAIFLVFHIPNAFLRSETATVALWQVLLLFWFGFGQALLFISRRNGYALVLSHAIWGMVLLTHSWTG